jgi:hypothetical protein
MSSRVILPLVSIAMGKSGCTTQVVSPGSCEGYCDTGFLGVYLCEDELHCH